MNAKNTDRIIRALDGFSLDTHHLTVWDCNELVGRGFPAELVAEMSRAFKSSDGYMLYFRGEVVSEFVGVQHNEFVNAIARALDIDISAAFEFTGRGFRMRAVIDKIESAISG